MDTVRLLVELGADVNVKAKNGLTPFLYACDSGDVVTARLLVKHGADVNVRTGTAAALFIVPIVLVTRALSDCW